MRICFYEWRFGVRMEKMMNRNGCSSQFSMKLSLRETFIPLHCLCEKHPYIYIVLVQNIPTFKLSLRKTYIPFKKLCKTSLPDTTHKPVYTTCNSLSLTPISNTTKPIINNQAQYKLNNHNFSDIFNHNFIHSRTPITHI